MARLTVLAALLLAAASAPAAGLPARQADITGLITSVGDGTRTILVEELRDPNTGAKASVTIDGSTRIWAVTGQTVTRVLADVLRVGSSVRVWFDGPVAMSYPVQGKAADIAIGTVSGAPMLDRQVLRERWMLITRTTAGISDQAIADPYVAC